MELRQLLCFVTVVEEEGFTRAAARLHLAQPGVSAQIRRLERELGQPLLDRSGRRVRPTEVGAALLPYARAALAAVEGVRRTAEEYTGLLRGRVRIGMVPFAAAHPVDVPGLLADFHTAHPQVEITLTEDTSDRMLAALHRGELDLVLAGLAAEEPPPGTGVRIVADEPLYAAVAQDHPLASAGGRAVPLAALAAYPLISLPCGTGVRGVLDRLCAEAGFRPRIAFEAAAPDTLLRLAARGLGVAVVPGLPTAFGLRALRIDDPRARGRVALVWRTDGPVGPAARSLLGRFHDALAQ
ncbi:LysR substrate-binding domain-containing protein [Streptomyces sp. NBC_01275]|uniref:LysR family transcriptional regulator n=1 Tax=Streptomyces sp. NBC_01275 TaxID=2903807 RepID=UPI002252C587|nr:LysR substrate-binding domain-containing protein [Streptomyces sp. NBC_01275]MCX4767088.1 LysR substrate-binding domain-containing protein [Streptomyces sp. NBC_01275]